MKSDTTIDQATELLKGRLAEIDSERGQIEKALDSLSSNGVARRPGRPKGSTKRKRGTRKGGTRATEAVKLIAETPGITASDIAKTMKIKPNYLYRVLSDLEKQKLVHKKGRTYTATSKGDALAKS